MHDGRTMGSGEASIKITFDLVTGTFLERLNRFMTVGEINLERTLAHLPNSGRLSTVLALRATIFLRKELAHPWRKSNFDIFAVQNAGVTIILDA